MLYFVFLTRRCNLKCTYCGSAHNPTISVAKEIEYPLGVLLDFLEKDPKPIIAFYGGEPLLNIPKLESIVKNVKNATFILQTNGLLLKNIRPFYLKHIQTILISIDGPEFITDFYRNDGTYQSILQNIKVIKKKGFKGDLVARMTVSVRSDVYRDVSHLLSLKSPSFDHVHWQLDVIWTDKEQWGDFKSWVRDSYNPGITKLIEKWIRIMKEKGEVMGIVPFIGIMQSLLSKRSVKLRCGAGIDAFAIQTNGNIYACPVCPEFDDFKVGNIFNNNPSDIKKSLLIQSPCTECDIYSICGGRCLFTNHHNFWGKEFFDVCETVKYLVSELMRFKPIVNNLIKEKKIDPEMLEYPKFNNSCEIIP